MSEWISTRKDLHIFKNEINLSPYVNSPYSCCALQKYSKSAVGLLAQRWCLFLGCAHPTALAPGGHETGNLSVQGLSIPHGIISSLRTESKYSYVLLTSSFQMTRKGLN